MTSRAGEDENCIVSLTFTNQSQAVKTLIAKNAPLKLIRGLAKGEIYTQVTCLIFSGSTN